MKQLEEVNILLKINEKEKQVLNTSNTEEFEQEQEEKNRER